MDVVYLHVVENTICYLDICTPVVWYNVVNNTIFLSTRIIDFYASICYIENVPEQK